MNKRSHETPKNTGPNDACDATIVDPGAIARARRELGAARMRKSACDIHGAIADPTRHLLLEALAVEPLCVCDLAELSGVSNSAVSHQLRVLRDLDLVAFSRDGKRAVYRLADDHVRALLALGLDHAAERGSHR
jgi:DNA-binding transcriptional ArsR family regulator